MASGLRVKVAAALVSTILAATLAFVVYRRIRPAEPEMKQVEVPGVIMRESTYREMLETFRHDGIALGNTPFDDLIQESVAMNEPVDKAKSHEIEKAKDNISITTGFLRDLVFDGMDPVTYFYHSEITLSQKSREFIEKYRFNELKMTTGPAGERTTVPKVTSNRIAVVAGDSVAFGVLLPDEFTLASQLQAGDAEVRYVNIGVSGSEIDAQACALERAAKRYPGAIERLVFVWCENDFFPEVTEAWPEWLKEYQDENGIEEVVVVYAAYLFNVAPESTRYRGNEGWFFPTFPERTAVFERLKKLGIRVVDFGALARAERDQAGSLFGAHSLYIDRVHWSRLGASKVAAAVGKYVPPAQPVASRKIEQRVKDYCPL